MIKSGTNNTLQLSGKTTQYLTGLPNASGFLKYVDKLNVKGRLNDYSAFSFNLKSFGRINDKYGSKAADDVMLGYVKKLSGFITDKEYLGHLGEDNFVALILRERKDAFTDFLSSVPVNFKDADKNPITMRISATIGIWDINEDISDVREVITRSTIALSQARNVLHQSVAVLTDSMMTTVSKRKDIMEHFNEALENEEFQVYYQPKVDSRTGMLIGAEGLVRWLHNDKLVSPGQFIPPLELTGEILLLDYYMLQHACADISRWKRAGLEPVTVSINFSRKDLIDPNLAVNIRDIVEESGIEKSLIEIEVTETVDDAEHSELAAFINKLHSMGIRTAIDDFGSGYSSLATLREYNVSTLKIDRSFINTDDFSWKDEIILTEIINMANKLGIDIITEGVEREDQLSFVNNAGCYAIQGYYYDKPLPEKEFVERLKSKHYTKQN